MWNVYRAVESVAILNDGIAICGKKNRWRKLSLNAQGSLRITSMLPNDPGVSGKQFGPSRKTNYGCTLKIAEFDNGGKVFLDSRGLLHLKSSKPNAPEVSLVLADNEVAAWTSDGYVCGPKFFFEEAVASQPAKVFERIMSIF